MTFLERQVHHEPKSSIAATGRPKHDKPQSRYRVGEDNTMPSMPHLRDHRDAIDSPPHQPSERRPHFTSASTVRPHGHPRPFPFPARAPANMNCHIPPPASAPFHMYPYPHASMPPQGSPMMPPPGMAFPQYNGVYNGTPKSFPSYPTSHLFPTKNMPSKAFIARNSLGARTIGTDHCKSPSSRFRTSGHQKNDHYPRIQPSPSYPLPQDSSQSRSKHRRSNSVPKALDGSDPLLDEFRFVDPTTRNQEKLLGIESKVSFSIAAEEETATAAAATSDAPRLPPAVSQPATEEPTIGVACVTETTAPASCFTPRPAGGNRGLNSDKTEGKKLVLTVSASPSEFDRTIKSMHVQGRKEADSSNETLQRTNQAAPDSPGPAFLSFMQELDEQEESNCNINEVDFAKYSSNDSFNLLPLLDDDEIQERASPPMIPFLSKSPQLSWDIAEEDEKCRSTGSSTPIFLSQPNEEDSGAEASTPIFLSPPGSNGLVLSPQQQVTTPIPMKLGQEQPAGVEQNPSSTISCPPLLFFYPTPPPSNNAGSDLDVPIHRAKSKDSGERSLDFKSLLATKPRQTKLQSRAASGASPFNDRGEDLASIGFRPSMFPQSPHSSSAFSDIQISRVRRSPACLKVPPVPPVSPHIGFPPSLLATNGGMRRSSQTPNRPTAEQQPFQSQKTPKWIQESKGKCVALPDPIPSKFQGDIEKCKDEKVPEFSSLVNFPGNVTLRQNRVLPNGMRCCVMCGCIRSTCSRSRTRKGNDNHLQRFQHPPHLGGDPSNRIIGTMDDFVTIPTQNKGLCTICDITVWSVTETGNQIKWCKGCKNFRPWAAFGEKGLATKCTRCRQRQRQKYALLKDSKRKMQPKYIP